MKFFGRGHDDIPALPLQQGERVLAVARDHGAVAAVATTRALYYGEELSPTPFVSVLGARWLPETTTLVLELVGEAAPQFVELDDPGLLPETVRERVQASIVVTSRVAVQGRRGVTLGGRRPPDGSGPITWQVSYDAGLDPEDPRVDEVVQATLRQLQEQVGPVGE